MPKLAVIDTNPLQGQCLAHILQSHRPDIQYVGQAQSGIRGLEFIQEALPDILFADIVFPDIDGFYLVQKIKDVHPRVQIAILTSSNKFDQIERFLHLGINSYLLKPLSYNRFLSEINNLCKAISKYSGTKTQYNYSDLLAAVRSGNGEPRSARIARQASIMQVVPPMAAANDATTPYQCSRASPAVTCGHSA